jgi:hypothetical protein
MSVAFERIIIVFLENATRDAVLRNPYMRDLRKKGVFLKNSVGLTHPSQPNYIAVTGGDIFNISTDDPGWVEYYGGDGPDVTCIVDLMEAQGITWKAYAENLLAVNVVRPSQSIPVDKFPFARTHVPFLSYPKIVKGSAKAKIVRAIPNFETDLKAGKLPQYCFYTPNLINDGHSLPTGERANPDEGANVENIASFLKTFLRDDPNAKFPPETLIVITFDESYPYEDDYAIYTLLIGDMLNAGTTRTEPYNHYSLLRSVEENFGIGTLGRNDEMATPYWFLRSRHHAD